jgi:hypothetical protein
MKIYPEASQPLLFPDTLMQGQDPWEILAHNVYGINARELHDIMTLFPGDTERDVIFTLLESGQPLPEAIVNAMVFIPIEGK